MKKALLILLALLMVVLTACASGKTTDQTTEPETEKTASASADVGATTKKPTAGAPTTDGQTVTEPTSPEPTDEPTSESADEPTTDETPDEQTSETNTPVEDPEPALEPDTLYSASVTIFYADENGFAGSSYFFGDDIYVVYPGASKEFALYTFIDNAVEIGFYGRNCKTEEKVVKINEGTDMEEDMTCRYVVEQVESVELIHNVGPIVVAKPIIYLYPEEDTLCSVTLDLNGKLTCTYPAYGENGWTNFTAKPDGTLIFPDGSEYYALYWEGLSDLAYDFSSGFCVKGEDTAAFLAGILPKLGLSAREANEFIVYWLPRLQENAYNLISFQTDVYTDNAQLNVSPAPDTCIRVFMAYKPLTAPVDLPAQTFETPERTGFTVVEWGGSEVTV